METKGFVPLDREKQLPGGLFVLVEKTSDPKRFFIRIGDKPESPAKAKVRHRRFGRAVDRT